MGKKDCFTTRQLPSSFKLLLPPRYSSLLKNLKLGFVSFSRLMLPELHRVVFNLIFKKGGLHFLMYTAWKYRSNCIPP
jgi:hypothetical protein